MRQSVLLFGFDAASGARARAALAALGLEVRFPARERYGLPLSQLVTGGKGKSSKPLRGQALTEPVAVFSALPEKMLDQALAALRAAGVDALKAVVTPTNCFWNVFQLAEELRRERAAMERR